MRPHTDANMAPFSVVHQTHMWGNSAERYRTCDDMRLATKILGAGKRLFTSRYNKTVFHISRKQATNALAMGARMHLKIVVFN